MQKSHARVLVVDDERFYREAIRESLAGAGLDCETAESGAEAIAAVGKDGFGAVVIDGGLVDPGVVEVVDAILAQRPETRVLVLATQADHDAVLESLRRGACDYLAKPLHDEELVLAVKRAVENHRVAAEWTDFRQRLCALDDRLAAVSVRAAASDAEERTAEVAQAVCETARAAVGAERASVLLHAAEAGVLEVVAAIGAPVPVAALDSPAPGEGVAGRVFAAAAPLLVEDVERDERFPRGATRTGYRSGSFAVTPIPGGDAPLGVLCAADRSGGVPFAGHDLALLRSIARHAGSLLAAAPAAPDADRPPAPPDFAVEGSQADDAELARAICDAVTTELEPERVIATALAAVGAALPASPVALYLLDNRSGSLRLEEQAAGAGPGDRSTLERSAGLSGLVLQTGHLVATDHPEKDPRFDAESDTPEDGSVRPLICVPIRVRGKTLGVLRAFPTVPEAARARTAEVLTASFSAAVRSVLLYRNLLDSIDELAKARRATRGA